MRLQISEASLPKIIQPFKETFIPSKFENTKCYAIFDYSMHLGPAITTNLFVCVRVPLKLLIQIYYYNFIWRRENTATNYFTDSIISHTYVKIPSVSQLYYLNNLS